LSGNSAGHGGGVFNGGVGGGILAALSITNSTLSGNSADIEGGGIYSEGGTVELINTIVAAQALGEDCHAGPAVTSFGHNLDSDGTCNLTAIGDIPNVDPLLGPLQLNEPGSTETHALLPGSPAIDAGDDSACPSTDQRGVPRPQGSRCDIGAYEALAVVQCSIDIKPGSDPNCFNINGHGVIPVAVLGSASFDVTKIDVSTLRFAGLDVRVKGNDRPQCSIEDVSGGFTSPEGSPDGYDDLVCQFSRSSSNWQPEDDTATLTGNLKVEHGGTPIVGTDEICIVP
jgi:hypothetical protein